MSLATKYRPRTWEDVTEQGLVIQMLKSMCESELSNRCFLLTGPAGTGKTTMGRLIATYLNGSTDNLIEIDAASNNGVEAMRDLVQQAETFPIGTKYKIILIDECHVLSPQAFQVLLKTFEEQPARTVFIMATTNPEKIPATILSRVQTFQLSKISLEGIYNRLKFVIDSEGYRCI